MMLEEWPKKASLTAPTLAPRHSERGGQGSGASEVAEKKQGEPGGSAAPSAGRQPPLHAAPPTCALAPGPWSGQTSWSPFAPVVVTASLPGRRQVGMGAFFIMGIEAFSEVSSPRALRSQDYPVPAIPPLDIPFFGGVER